MATIIKQKELDYQPHPGRADGWKLMTDMSRQKKGINPQYLNFDMRELPPYQYNAAYHFHRYADELFMILSGSATLRTPDGLTEITKGDIIFFEAGETGAHQLYNHTDEPCTYLDLRSSIGYDVIEYPDSDKLIITPSAETFRKGQDIAYFDGEQDVDIIWENLRRQQGGYGKERRLSEKRR